jgi:hypothetical protein
MCTSSAVDYFRGARLVGLAVGPGGLLLTMARSFVELPGFVAMVCSRPDRAVGSIEVADDG